PGTEQDTDTRSPRGRSIPVPIRPAAWAAAPRPARALCPPSYRPGRARRRRTRSGRRGSSDADGKLRLTFCSAYRPCNPPSWVDRMRVGYTGPIIEPLAKDEAPGIRRRPDTPAMAAPGHRTTRRPATAQLRLPAYRIRAPGYQ